MLVICSLRDSPIFSAKNGFNGVEMAIFVAKAIVCLFVKPYRRTGTSNWCSYQSSIVRVMFINDNGNKSQIF